MTKIGVLQRSKKCTFLLCGFSIRIDAVTTMEIAAAVVKTVRQDGLGRESTCKIDRFIITL